MTVEAIRPVEAGEVIALRPYPLDNLRARGYWVATVGGPDPKYGVQRDFVNGSTKGRERHYGPKALGAPSWVLRSEPGWCDHCHQPVPTVELIAALDIGWSIVAVNVSSEDLLALWEAGPPTADYVDQVAGVLDPERGEVYAADLEEPF